MRKEKVNYFKILTFTLQICNVVNYSYPASQIESNMVIFLALEAPGGPGNYQIITSVFSQSHITVLMFIFSEKATKFCEISTIDLITTT